MVRMLSLLSYFLAKKPDKKDLLDFLDVTVDDSLVFVTCSIEEVSSDLSVDFAATDSAADLVDLALLDLFDDFDFLVAIIPPLMIICIIISQK